MVILVGIMFIGIALIFGFMSIKSWCDVKNEWFSLRYDKWGRLCNIVFASWVTFLLVLVCFTIILIMMHG